MNSETRSAAITKIAIRQVISATLGALALLAVSACANDQPAVELGGKRFTVEIADSPEEQALGLMFRDELPKDGGMLFLMGDDQRRAFYMKNCRISLDIIYFDKDLKLVNVHEDVPPCKTSRCPTYRSDGPARYVLELNGGTYATLGIGAEPVLKLLNVH